MFLFFVSFSRVLKVFSVFFLCFPMFSLRSGG